MYIYIYIYIYGYICVYIYTYYCIHILIKLCKYMSIYTYIIYFHIDMYIHETNCQHAHMLLPKELKFRFETVFNDFISFLGTKSKLLLMPCFSLINFLTFIALNVDLIVTKR
jgi:hypothetical protein